MMKHFLLHSPLNKKICNLLQISTRIEKKAKTNLQQKLSVQL